VSQIFPNSKLPGRLDVTRESQGKSGVTPNFPGSLGVMPNPPPTVGLPGKKIISGSGFRGVIGHAPYKNTLKNKKCLEYKAEHAEGGP
jgi:hypothetical protein